MAEYKPVPSLSADEVDTILKKVLRPKPKPEDMSVFRQLLDRHPEVVKRFVDITEHAFDAMLKPMAGDSAATLEILKRQRRVKQAELGYSTASPLEKLLIDAVVMAWVGFTDTQRRASNVWSESHTLTVGEYWDKRVSTAQRRYLRAVESLARIRRLELPALQINIGAQQVNQVNAAAPDRPRND